MATLGVAAVHARIAGHRLRPATKPRNHGTELSRAAASNGGDGNLARLDCDRIGVRPATEGYAVTIDDELPFSPRGAFTG